MKLTLTQTEITKAIETYLMIKGYQGKSFILHAQENKYSMTVGEVENIYLTEEQEKQFIDMVKYNK